MLLTASVLTKRAPEELTFTVNQYHIRKLENAKGKKNIKCITIGISLHKPLKCFKNIKVEVSKKNRNKFIVKNGCTHRRRTCDGYFPKFFTAYLGYILVQGQLVSKRPFLVFKLTKKPTKSS